jgi:hypothetical protein
VLVVICLGQATESFIDLESGSELSVQKASGSSVLTAAQMLVKGS